MPMMLLAFVLVVAAAAADDLPTPNNIQFLGRGYNIFKGDPHSKTVDPGFEAQIFDLDSYTKGRQTSDQPTTISQSRTYDAALVAEVTIGGGPVGVAFSASPGFRKIHREGVRNELLVVETTSRCEVYTAMLLRNELPPQTQNFRTALNSLPTTFDFNRPDAEIFWRFFRNFGTHVAVQISFGSRLSVRHEVLSEALDKFHSRAVSLEVAAVANAEAIYLKTAPKIDRLKTDLEAYSGLIVSTEILAVGGLSNLNRLHEDWHDLTLADDLVPIQYVLDPIDNYVDADRRDTVRAALAQFCRVFPNALCTMESERSRAVCAATEFTDQWLQTSCSLRQPQRWVQIGCGSEHGLGGLRLTRSARQPQRYLINTGCMPLREADNAAEDAEGQYAEPQRRRPREDQQYGCAEGEYVTGLRLNRACFGDENLSVRCKRTARPFRSCAWTQPSPGIATVPSYTTTACPAGEVVNAIGFVANPKSDLGQQQIRVHCCKFDEECDAHELGPFDESDWIPPTEPPQEDPTP